MSLHYQYTHYAVLRALYTFVHIHLIIITNIVVARHAYMVMWLQWHIDQNFSRYHNSQISSFENQSSCFFNNQPKSCKTVIAERYQHAQFWFSANQTAILLGLTSTWLDSLPLYTDLVSSSSAFVILCLPTKYGPPGTVHHQAYRYSSDICTREKPTSKVRTLSIFTYQCMYCS